MKIKSALISAALFASLTISAQSETLDQAAERLADYLTECSLSQGPYAESLSESEMYIMTNMIAETMDMMVDGLKNEMIKENIDTKVLSTCVDSMKAMGCDALESDEPPAGCEGIDEAMN